MFNKKDKQRGKGEEIKTLLFCGDLSPSLIVFLHTVLEEIISSVSLRQDIKKNFGVRKQKDMLPEKKKGSVTTTKKEEGGTERVSWGNLLLLLLLLLFLVFLFCYLQLVDLPFHQW